MSIFLRPWFIIVLSVGLVGCSTTSLVSSGDRLKTNKNSIRVHLLDGRVISLSAEDYRIDPQSDSSYITGQGTESSASGQGGRRFTGTIGLGDIDRIEVTEPTTFTKIMVPFVVVTLSLGLLFLILLGANPPDMGG